MEQEKTTLSQAIKFAQSKMSERIRKQEQDELKSKQVKLHKNEKV